jgi:hypothetical protein
MNSLYGRFGMDDNFLKTIVIHKDFLEDFKKKYLYEIDEIIDLGE